MRHRAISKALVLVRIALANIVSSMLNVLVGLVLLFGSASLRTIQPPPA